MTYRIGPASSSYLWDEDALYVALRTLDQKPFAAEAKFWEGDAVEFDVDISAALIFPGAEWPREASAGAVHCFFTAMQEATSSIRALCFGLVSSPQFPK